MKEQLKRFLQDSQGVNSIKRLLGFQGFQVFLIFSIVEIIFFLIHKDATSAILTTWNLGVISATMLGLSIPDHFKGVFNKTPSVNTSNFTVGSQPSQLTNKTSNATNNNSKGTRYDSDLNSSNFDPKSTCQSEGTL